MYELKPILPQFDIKQPTCMYSLKSVGLSKEEFAIGIAKTHDRSSTVDFVAIKNRQENVLRQLNELKEQMEGIRKTLGLCQKGIKHTESNMETGMQSFEPLKHDIVINAHPKFIPYALLILKNLWKSLLNIEVRCFSHSSITDVGPTATEFQQRLSDIKMDSSKPKIQVTLIWMDCEHTEMICSPAMYVPIYGEVNILRYLSRVGPVEYRYENSPSCNEIDVVLDICYQLLRCTTTKSKANFIRSLSNRLQNQHYFGVDQFSIADAAVYSSLKRMSSITAKDLTPALNDWLKRVEPTISV